MKDDKTKFGDCTNFLLCFFFFFSFSAEFGSVVEKSLKAVLDALVEDMAAQSGGSLTSGMLLAKLLPRVAQMGPILLNDPSDNRFIQIIQSSPEVELFFTLIYTNMPTS